MDRCFSFRQGVIYLFFCCLCSQYHSEQTTGKSNSMNALFIFRVKNTWELLVLGNWYIVLYIYEWDGSLASHTWVNSCPCTTCWRDFLSLLRVLAYLSNHWSIDGDVCSWTWNFAPLVWLLVLVAAWDHFTSFQEFWDGKIWVLQLYPSFSIFVGAWSLLPFFILLHEPVYIHASQRHVIFHWVSMDSRSVWGLLKFYSFTLQ